MENSLNPLRFNELLGGVFRQESHNAQPEGHGDYKESLYKKASGPKIIPENVRTAAAAKTVDKEIKGALVLHGGVSDLEAQDKSPSVGTPHQH